MVASLILYTVLSYLLVAALFQAKAKAGKPTTCLPAVDIPPALSIPDYLRR